MNLKLICVLQLCFQVSSSMKKPNNVCKNFSDYPTIDNNRNCWYHPDMFSAPEKLARNHGFAFQSHRILTEDGYYLTVFRIQDNLSRNGKKQPILLHHGLLSTATCFMVSGKKSLAFFLARMGYDVWLSNHRGNIYSLGHSHLNASNPKYWDFSFHEIGLFDLPAVLEYISKKTGNWTKTIYIGHSMGCTVCLIYSSLRSTHAEKHLKGFIALGPASSMKYFSPEVQPLLPSFFNIIQGLLQDNLTVLAPNPGKLSRMVYNFCKNQIMVCLSLFNLINGEDGGEIDAVTFMLFLSTHPGRTSLKCVAHFAQLIMAGKFQYYDYGTTQNMIRYNSTLPPQYPLQKIKIPVHLFYGLSDNLVTPDDVVWLYNQLETTEKSINQVPEDGKGAFNHVNFLAAKNIRLLLYETLIGVLKKLQ